MSIRDAGRLLIRPREGAKRIARRYLIEQITENQKKYPNVASFCFDYMTVMLIEEGRYESRFLNTLASRVFPHLERRGTCLDVGANIGKSLIILFKIL